MSAGPFFITDVTHDTNSVAGQMELASSQAEKDPETTLFLAFRANHNYCCFLKRITLQKAEEIYLIQSHHYSNKLMYFFFF